MTEENLVPLNSAFFLINNSMDVQEDDEEKENEDKKSKMAMEPALIDI